MPWKLLKKSVSIRSRLLLLAAVICVAFVVITSSVLFSLNQIKDLSTDVARTQMEEVIVNSGTTRDLSALFSNISMLSFSLGGDGSALQLRERELTESAMQISARADSLPLRQEMDNLSLILADLIGHYRAINQLLISIEHTDRAIIGELSSFERDVSGWLIEITMKGESTQFIDQIISLLAGYRESFLLIGKLHETQKGNFLTPRRITYDSSPIPVIDDLLLRLETLTASTPEVAAYGRRILGLLEQYRLATLELGDRINRLSIASSAMAVQKEKLLEIIGSIDARSNQTSQVLTRELDTIIRSSVITVLVLSVLVILVVAATVLLVIRTSINRPIRKIIDGIEHFRRGELLRRISLRGDDELGTIGNALNNMANDLHVTYSELKESEDKFYQVFENELNALLIFDHQSGLCLDANRVALDLYGYNLAEIKRLSLDELEKDEEAGRPDHDGWVQRYHHRRDGSRFPVEVHTGSFQRQGNKYLFKSVRDMTHQRYLQEYQQKTMSLLEATLESTSEGVLALSRSGEVINFNQKFLEMFRIPEIRLHHAPGRRVLPHILQQLKDRHEFMRMIRSSYQSNENITNEVVELNDGRVFECHSQPQFLDKEIVGRVWNFRDVSEYFKIMVELRDKENRLAHLAHHDPLTGLANRLLFMDRLEHAIRKAQRSKQRLALFFIDLDRFKSINDSLGHMVGDILLKSFSERLTGTTRQIDTIARLGGDEFTLILDSVNGAQEAAVVARKILETLKEPFQANEHQFYVTSSIGISFYPEDGSDAETLLRNADAAMYRSKDEGRNTFHFYTEDMTTQALERVQMESSLREALEQDQFEVWYQPQYQLVSGELIGAEALVRWKHPDQGLIGPDRFLATAEESGLIAEIDEWVFRDVCRQLARWQSEAVGLDQLRFAVNLSGAQLRHETLPETFAGILEATGCDPCLLELEITEGFIMHQPELSTRILGELRELGLHLSIDDFGTGYSSLSYLKRLPINRLKIDRSFVMDIADDPNDAAIARSIIALGHSMSLEVVAEGIEDQAQEAFLKAEGCDMGQGYLYSRPVPAADLAALLSSGRRLTRAV